MKPKTPPDIEKQLREALRDAGKSISYVSRRAGVSRSCISRFLSGRRSLTLPVAARLAVALKLTLKHRHTSRRGNRAGPPAVADSPTPGQGERFPGITLQICNDRV